MNIKEYLKKLQNETTNVFDIATQDTNIKKLGEVHHISSFLYEFQNAYLNQMKKKC